MCCSLLFVCFLAFLRAVVVLFLMFYAATGHCAHREHFLGKSDRSAAAQVGTLTPTW